jgi:hypothetical protein
MAGTYSNSNTGRWKKSLDAEIAKAGIAIDVRKEDYLKQLVLLCTRSRPRTWQFGGSGRPGVATLDLTFSRWNGAACIFGSVAHWS